MMEKNSKRMNSEPKNNGEWVSGDRCKGCTISRHPLHCTSIRYPISMGSDSHVNVRSNDRFKCMRATTHAENRYLISIRDKSIRRIRTSLLLHIPPQSSQFANFCLHTNSWFFFVAANIGRMLPIHGWHLRIKNCDLVFGEFLLPPPFVAKQTKNINTYYTQWMGMGNGHGHDNDDFTSFSYPTRNLDWFDFVITVRF